MLSGRHALKPGGDLSQSNLSGYAHAVSDAVNKLIGFAQNSSSDVSKGTSQPEGSDWPGS